jgi:pimeloyl-ACP methyl ester carboxylesterase
LGVLLAATACQHGSPSASPSLGSIGQAAVVWTDCYEGFQCTRLSVPVDYSNTQGLHISLALIRKPATDPAVRIGSLLMNPGGPGESGVDFLLSQAQDFDNLNKQFDLVSWDPRGVGASSPIQCLDGPQMDALLALDPVLDDPQEKQQYIVAHKSFVQACWRRNQALLPFMDSKSTAQDMERIRAATGDTKMTYLGFSYGTFIGQWYAHLFPSRLRAMVLDGVVFGFVSSSAPPSELVGAAAVYEKSFQAYIRDCSSRPTCPYRTSADPEAQVELAMARLDAKPVTVGSRQLTRGLGLTALLAALYDPASWPDLDRSLASLDRGDGAPMLAFADAFNERNDDGTYANRVNGSLDATDCIDGPSEMSDISAYDQVGPYLVKASPLFGPMVQYSPLTCAYWPVEGQGLEQPSIEGAPPILLVGATGDPATPYQWAQLANAEIPGSVLLTREGNGHTSYGFSDCIDTATDDYLLHLVLPAPRTICST